MIIEGQPQALQEAMKFFAAMMMVERGLMRLVKRVPGDDGAICIFENLAGDLIGVKRPSLECGIGNGEWGMKRPSMRKLPILLC